jgi:hypothetical protein
VAAPATLPWRRSTFPGATEQLRRFQAALKSSTGDPRIVASGVWDTYFSEVLRDHGAPTVAAPPLSVVQIDKAFWNLHMKAPHATAEPWGAGAPGEADLYELVGGLGEGDADKASCQLKPRASKVDIVVHYRGLDPLDGANVRVTLLWWTDPKKKGKAKWDDATSWPTAKAGPPATVGWTAAVNEVLNSADGKTTKAVDGGWKFALGNSTQSHRLTLAGQTLDPTHSGVVTFDLNLTGLKKNTLVLLVAVIRAGATPADDIALAEAALEDMALTSPNVAVRSVQITT